MFTGLFKKKSKDAIAEYRRAGEQIGVFSLALTGVEDPFDPDPLWDRKYGGNSAIIEEMTEDKDFRLQSALDGCRNIKFVRDEAGRFREQTPVFTDVVIWVPAAKYRQDTTGGGHRIEALTTNLANLHGKKFNRSLPGDRDPNYVVMPDDELDEHTMVFQFGVGVFVPTEHDELLGAVVLRRKKDSEIVKLPEWSFWANGRQKKRPVGVYVGQGSLLLTGDRTGPVRSPLWFPNPQGFIQINLGAADSERVYADDDQIEVVETILPKKDGDPFQWVLRDKRGGASDDNSMVIEVSFVEEPKTERAPGLIPPEPSLQPPPQGKKKKEKKGRKGRDTESDTPPPVVMGEETPRKGKGRLAQRVAAAEAASEEAEDEPATRLRAEGPEPAISAPRARTPSAPRSQPQAPAAPPAAPRARTPSGSGGSGPKTGLDRFFAAADNTDRSAGAPISNRFSLKISGAALLRIDSERRLPGLEEWVIWFDESGRPVGHEEARAIDPARALALAATAQSRHLFYRLPGEDSFKPVKAIPCSLTTENDQYLDVIPSPVPEIYHAVVLLNREISLPLSSKTWLLGRSDANPKAEQPDLPLELLDHPQSLRWSGDGPAGARLNSLNLSRRHVSLRLAGGRLEVGVADGRTPVYVLDKDAQLLKELPPGEKATLMMEPDEHFIVGSYMLRFHQERMQTMLSRDASILRREGAG